MIVSAALLILILWTVVGVRYLHNLRKEIKNQWECVDELLRHRHDLIPNLIETLRLYKNDQEKLVERLITERKLAAKEYHTGAKKIEFEHDLTSSINEIFALGKGTDFGKDTNFLELKTEINDLNRNTEERTKKYNDMVRFFNKQIDSFALKPLAFVFRVSEMKIFEMEM